MPRNTVRKKQFFLASGPSVQGKIVKQAVPSATPSTKSLEERKTLKGKGVLMGDQMKGVVYHDRQSRAEIDAGSNEMSLTTLLEATGLAESSTSMAKVENKKVDLPRQAIITRAHDDSLIVDKRNRQVKLNLRRAHTEPTRPTNF
jgi:hypothetical protein